MISSTSTAVLALFLLLLVSSSTKTVVASAYTGTGNHHPALHRRAMAGLWKLTPSPTLALKEITIRRGSKNRSPKPEQPVLFLLLKEDGTFVRQKNDDVQNEENEKKLDVDQSWESFLQSKIDNQPSTATSAITPTTVGSAPFAHMQSGRWDYRNGQLLLAADRLEDDPQHQLQQKSDHFATNHKSPTRKKKSHHVQDTLLVGQVLAIPQRMQPSQNMEQQNEQKDTKNNNNNNNIVDTHLTVPQGLVQTGTFMYPRKHKQFFEQPLVHANQVHQHFQLHQVFGAQLPNQDDDDHLIEKFSTKEFHNKTFFLTTQPLKQRKPKGKKRWSIKYNDFVEDPPSKAAQDAHDASQNQPSTAIRVLKVHVFPNNTFSTIAGLGDATILRGKFDVIGNERDQLWMQVWRFGFGRSVSGSTYSEGTGLSHEDAKSYWGYISYQDDEEEHVGQKAGKNDSDNQQLQNDNNNGESDAKPKRLQAKGSVIYGYGLEPQPIARFILREATEAELKEDDELLDDDEDEEEEQDVDNNGDIRLDTTGDDDGVDWSISDNLDAFQ